MKCLLLIAVFLLSGFALHAIPKQADKTSPNQETTKDSTNHSTPPQPSLSRPSPKPEQNGSNSKAEKPCWFEQFLAPVIANWPVIAVAIWGILVARGTLKVVERQAISMRRQTTHLRNSVIQSRNAARAAKISADALIASERAWIMVDIEWQLGAHIFDTNSIEEGFGTGIYVNYVCRNVGKSFAQIKEKGYVFKRFTDHPPNHPDFDSIKWIDFADEYLAPNAASEPHELSGITCAGKRFSDGIMVFYGRVEYRDVYGEHETRFGYWVTPQGIITRMPANTYPEYNKHT